MIIIGFEFENSMYRQHMPAVYEFICKTTKQRIYDMQ